MQTPSPLRGRYLVRDRSAYMALAGFDLMSMIAARLTPRLPVRPIERLLVGVGGHLGDAIIATAAVARLRAWLPTAEIAVVGSSAAKPVFDEHPAVNRFYQLDHWKADRSGAPFLRRLSNYRAMMAELTPRLRAESYDAAIDLYPYYPNMALLFWRAGVPRRVGYVSGGGGPLLTDAFSWKPARQHVAAYHDGLLEALGAPGIGAPRYALRSVDDAARARAQALLNDAGVKTPFVLLHPGTGSDRKAWPLSSWLALAEMLRLDGYSLVVTGAGATERILADQIADVSGACNFVDRTTIPELRALMQLSAFVVAVDSAAGHLAAADDVPAAVIMSGMADPEHWRPLSPAVSIATAPVSCAPCFRGNGCDHMSCVRNVTPVQLRASVATGVRSVP